MKIKHFFFLFLPFVLVSCMTQSKSSDRQVDSRLGVEAPDDNQDAQSALQQLQQSQQQEQRRQLERQISDPLTG